MKEHSSKRAMVLRRFFSAFALLAIIAAMALSPSYIKGKLDSDIYREWMQTKTEPKVMIIEVWHIVGFKPCVGSLGNWLRSRTDEYKKTHIGIHFNVKSMTPGDAEAELKRGLRPDVISFMSGTVKPGELFDLSGLITAENKVNTSCGSVGGRLFALPYCASGRLLLYDPNAAVGMDPQELDTLCGTASEFKSGKSPAAICDIRETSDMYRAGLMGKAPYFEAVPFSGTGANDLVQYLGIDRDIDPDKLKYALGFIEHVIDTASQDTLCDIGLLPADPSAKADYEYEWLEMLRCEYATDMFPDCFAD